MSAPGVILAAASSGSGKTTITLALSRAFRRRGLRVSAAKSGPDYIDSAFLSAACGTPCLNLDAWAMRAGTLAALVAQLERDGDLVICEGVMGLFDGIDANGTGSTAELAAITGWPVVLVIDARGAAASAAAIVHGLAHPPASLQRNGLRVAGVIFNRVGGPGHAQLLADAVQRGAPEIAVLGAMPRRPELTLPERHLGLVQASERPELNTFLERAAAIVEENVDLNRLHTLAAPAQRHDPNSEPTSPLPPLGQRIAVASDTAFSFAYPATLAGWRAAGAELSFFSPLADGSPRADSDAIYLPGGYPELHAGRLAAAAHCLDGLRRAAARGAVIYGECGGYMMLGRTLVDAEGHNHRLADLLPVETSFAEPRLHLGYREVTVSDSGPLGATGTPYRGHEFHYATVLSEGGDSPLFGAIDAARRQLPAAGRRIANVMGSFVHLIDRAIV